MIVDIGGRVDALARTQRILNRVCLGLVSRIMLAQKLIQRVLTQRGGKLGNFNIQAAHSVKRCEDNKRVDQTGVKKTWLTRGTYRVKTGEGN